MLARYKLYRGKRPADDPAPIGVRQDSRMHTRHCLRPSEAIVKSYLADPTPDHWSIFEDAYIGVLEARFRSDRKPFDDLALLASQRNVYIGCSCPTKTNPDMNHCHTVLALRFMKSKYPELKVELPEGP